MWELLSVMFVGLLLGGVARLFVRNNTVRGCFPTMAVGLLGSVVGWLIFAKVFDTGTNGGLIGSVVGSIIVLVVLSAFQRGRGPRPPY